MRASAAVRELFRLGKRGKHLVQLRTILSSLYELLGLVSGMHGLVGREDERAEVQRAAWVDSRQRSTKALSSSLASGAKRRSRQGTAQVGERLVLCLAAFRFSEERMRNAVGVVGTVGRKRPEPA